MRTNQFRVIMLVLLMAVICLGTMNAQTITVTGIVTDAADGTSITGCSVVNNRSKSGAITDVNGRYSIQAQKGDVLLFRFIGYKEEKRVVKSAKLDVKMKTDDVALEECVVVGYGTMKTKAVTGAYVAVCPTAMYDMDARMNTEEYGRIQENGFKSVADAPLSTFSIDVDPASYSNMRRFINRGELPPADAIRTEELVNYFSYDYPKPTGNDPVKITVEAGTCTWNTAHRLVRIGLKAKEIPTEQLPASNLVFLIDVSGSMWGANRLDFNNDAKDAGDMGAGHTVTAFYEVIPAGVKNEYVGKVDDLKYQKKEKMTLKPTGSDELLIVKLRYKASDKDVSRKMELPFVDNKGDSVSSDFRFASAVAMFGQLLRDSDFKGIADYDKVIKLAKQGLNNDERGYRREFIRLVEAAKGLEKTSKN